MQPLILAKQTRQGVADFLEATFSATTPGYEDFIKSVNYYKYQVADLIGSKICGGK